ncbi:MAG: polyprenyl synthetase family protein [Paludibacteraceae bacterium]|nr:polyprenyl synthetase family protein [Paludibacteraceae bacterium]
MSIEEIHQPIAAELAEVRRLLEAEIQRPKGVFSEVLAYILSAHGKQLRMQLVLLSAAICHGVSDKTCQTALALEFLHNASLVHDDVVDQSPVRHNQPSVYQRWTNKAAVLTGDYMLSRVIEIIGELRSVRIWQIIAHLGTQLADGEISQLHINRSMWISEDDYYHIISGKTASLFAACMEAGAESSAASPKQVKSLKTFGWNLGMCFQIKDDVLDYSDSEQIDKPTMNDLRSGNVTLPLLISLERAPKEEADAIRLLAEQPIDRVGEETIRNFVMRYEGITYAYRRMAYYRDEALTALNSAFHDSPARRSLTALLDMAIHRVR